jgi:hypothetical protein
MNRYVILTVYCTPPFLMTPLWSSRLSHPILQSQNRTLKEALRQFFALLPADIVDRTLKQTTQYARVPMGDVMKRFYKSPYPTHIVVARRNEDLLTDVVYSDTPAIDNGSTRAAVFSGRTSHVLLDVDYGKKTDKQFVNTLKDLYVTVVLPLISLVIMLVLFAVHVFWWTSFDLCALVNGQTNHITSRIRIPWNVATRPQRDSQRIWQWIGLAAHRHAGCFASSMFALSLIGAPRVNRLIRLFH